MAKIINTTIKRISYNHLKTDQMQWHQPQLKAHDPQPVLGHEKQEHLNPDLMKTSPTALAQMTYRRSDC